MSPRPAETTAAARAVEATKVYGTGATAVVALDEVTVDLPAGRFTAIMGPSGSGKSTLMHCLAGLDNLTEGRAFLGDVELGSLSDKASPPATSTPETVPRSSASCAEPWTSWDSPL